MPLTRDRQHRLDARPLAALDPLGLARQDDAQLLRPAVVELQVPPKRWMPRPVLYSTATSAPPSRCTRASLTARTSTIAPRLDRRDRGRQQADVRQAELHVLTGRDGGGGEAMTAISIRAGAASPVRRGRRGSIASREHT